MLKNFNKKLLLTLSLICVFTPNVYGKDISVTVNGTKVDFTDAKPYVDENNRTLVPLRPIGDALGLEVQWNKADKAAVFTKTIEAPDKKNSFTSVTFYVDSKSFCVDSATNGERNTSYCSLMDTAAVIKNDRVYAPVRYLAEKFDKEVSWDKGTNTVLIVDSKKQ